MIKLGRRFLRSGGEVFPVEVSQHDSTHIRLEFDWRPGSNWVALKDEIKFGMQGAKFNADSKCWTAQICPRNRFVLNYLDAETSNPYDVFDRQVQPYETCTRQLYAHQKTMLAHVLDKRQCILAAEMGTGKTLVVIEALEIVKPRLAWYIAPKFALQAIYLEFTKWRAKVRPTFLSYEQMKKIVSNWESGKLAPDFLVFDESAYVKSPNSDRSQYAQGLADGIRTDHESLDEGRGPYIVLMSGAPAPKSPKDWWKQCEIACPGYLRESHPVKFEQRLALIRQETSFAGGSYPKLVTWWDDPNKCKVCGQDVDVPDHRQGLTPHYHAYEKSIDEVGKLYRRLKGLVYIIRKKDCLDLPDKIYREVACPIDAGMKRAMNTIVRTSETTIKALTRLRELSDGFQYRTDIDETQHVKCDRCKGTGMVIEYEPEREITCPVCDGTGTTNKEVRKADLVATPKDAALVDLLEECEETGRIVIYAGFTASVDRCVELCKKQKWSVIRVDGRGVWTSEPMQNPLEVFQLPMTNPKGVTIPRLAFVAHPATAKTALTLTASSMIVYFSNTFIGDDRIQSEDRIHRIGMDVNRGATIVDLLHLPADKYVLDNLKKKRKLQSITLGEFQYEIQGYIDKSDSDKSKEGGVQ
jgi:SNF2 family DNA or RNA helicase